MLEGLFSTLGVEYVDHIAVTSSSLETALRDYLSLPGSRLVRGPGLNDAQRVRYAFVRLAEGTTVEILSPLENSPISAHLQRGGGAYHFCFAVADIAHAVGQAIVGGARLLVEPTPDPAFDGRKVAFFTHSAHGLFELVEARPLLCASSSSGAAANAPADQRPSVGAARLRQIFKTVFPHLEDAEISRATYDQTTGWDSLGHLQLISQLEIEFGVKVPAETIGTLTSFDRLLAFMAK